MLDGYLHDLEPGDEFRPVTYTVTQHMAAAYAHGVEETSEVFYAPQLGGGRQLRLPTSMHTDKMRLLEENCTKERRLHGEQGATTQRVHYEFEAQYHSLAYVGDELVVSGRVIDKYWKRGRQYLSYELEVNTTDGRLVTTYHDKTVLDYRKAEG